MSKVKMRCITCGKWFQSANAKEVTCPECTQKARKEKMAAKTTPPPASKTIGQVAPGQGIGTSGRSVPPPPKPKSSSTGTSHWLDTQEDVKVVQPDQPSRPKLPISPLPHENRGTGGLEKDGGYRGPGAPGTYRDDRGERGERGAGGYREGNTRGNYREGGYRGPGGYRENDYRSTGPYRVGGGMGLPDTAEPRPRQPITGGPHRGPRPGAPGEPRPEKFRGKPAGQKKTPKPKPETPPKPKREKIPPPAPFVPTAEQIAQVEARYRELAVPAEFDGIRSQISKELGIPKTAVKKIVKEFREREQIPSWWDIQSFKGTSEELEKIRAIYVPFLPLPPVGVHKQIAEQLALKPVDVYQAIKAIRQEMNLPQYNDPALHGIELKPRSQKIEAAEAQAEGQEKEATEQAETQAEGQDKEATEQAEAQAEGQEKEVTEQAEAQAEDQEKEAAENQTEEKKQEGEVSSIETGTTSQKVGDTTEVVAAGATDTKDDDKA